MHIWVMNQSFRPEPNAPANRIFGLAQVWLAQGATVQVLAGLPYRPDGVLPPEFAGITRYRDDVVGGVAVRRHAEPVGVAKRAWPQLLAQLQLAWQMYRCNINTPPEGRYPDVIVASVPDFFHLFAAWRLARRYQAKLVLDLRDMWPDIFVGVGVLKNKLLLWGLDQCARFGYGKADLAITVTRGMREDLAAKGVAFEGIHVLPNGLSPQDFAAIDTAAEHGAGQRMRSSLHLNPLTKVVLYVGNHGKAQALGQVVDAARLLMQRSDIQFIFAGDGADRERVEKLAKGLPNVQFLGQQPKDAVWALLDMATVAISCLQDTPVFKATVPSKIAEIMATRTPVIGAVQGEAAENIQQSEGGVVVPPEQPDKLAKAIESLIDNPAKCSQMGDNGRKYAQTHHHLGRMAEQYLDLLHHVKG